MITIRSIYYQVLNVVVKRPITDDPTKTDGSITVNGSGMDQAVRQRQLRLPFTYQTPSAVGPKLNKLFDLRSKISVLYITFIFH